MFLGQFKAMTKEAGEEQKDSGQTQKPPEADKTSSSSEDFLKTPEAREFSDRWAGKLKDGKPVVTRRGVTDLLGSLRANSSMSDKMILKEADRILLRLSGLDGFSSILSGLKAKSEGLIKGLKQALAGGG
ncbi:MAG: hypothetical protein U0R44_02675 [Candidatus Micrarchaeia archaeon]